MRPPYDDNHDLLISQKDRILSCAAELFMHNGYHATTVRQIGERLGMTQSSLYYHAKSKPQILFALNRRFMDYLVNEMETIQGTTTLPATAKLRAVVGLLLTVVADHKAEVTVVLRERRSLPPKDAKEVQQQRDLVDGIIDTIIRDGISEGDFRDADIRLSRLAITGMCNWAYEWYDSKGTYDLPEIIDHFAEMAIRALS